MKDLYCQPGDLFSFPLNNKEFAYGRVVLDVYNQGIKKKLIDKNSALYFTDNIILVEIYKQISDKKEKVPDHLQTLIPGIFTGNGFLKAKLWPIIGNDPIDPTKVDFPESLSHNGYAKSIFTKGELLIESDIPYEKTEEINIYPTTVATILISEIVLYMLGRKSEINNPIDPNIESRDPAKYDIRFSPYKEWVHAQVKEDMHQSYYETAKAKGFDLKRFYETDKKK